MVLIAEGENKWIIEYCPAFFKTYFMLCQIDTVFVIIPLKNVFHLQIIPLPDDYQNIEPFRATTLPNQPPQPFSPRLLHHLHQLLRFAELFDQAVYVLHFHAATGRDATSPGGVQNIGI